MLTESGPKGCSLLSILSTVVLLKGIVWTVLGVFFS